METLLNILVWMHCLGQNDYITQNIVLFYTLPVSISSVQLRKLQTDLLNFMWNYEQHRIARSILYASENDRGLAFPNLLCYYYAAQLRA